MKRKLTALFLSLALATTNVGIVPIADAAQNDPMSKGPPRQKKTYRLIFGWMKGSPIIMLF